MGVEDGFGLTVTVADAADLDPVKGTLDLVHLTTEGSAVGTTHTHLDLLLRISITLNVLGGAFGNTSTSTSAPSTTTRRRLGLGVAFILVHVVDKRQLLLHLT